MKCQKCGAEIPEGSLYCEKCGQDIHIVPDFTEFAERKAEDTVKALMENLDEDDADFGISPEGANDERPHINREPAVTPKTKPKNRWIKFAILAFSVMILVSFSLGFINRSTNTEYIAASARKAANSGDVAKAIALLEGIKASDSEDVDALIYLSTLYMDTEDMVKYENLLLSIIGMPFATSEQNAACYEMLLAIYRSSEDYVSMAEILLTCNNVEIREKYSDYCLMVPELNLDDGYYGTDQLLKITVPGTAHIYYTLDGSDPDVSSYEYQVPLLLSKGEYDIKIRAVNSYGVWSPVVEGKYVIESEELYEQIEPQTGNDQQDNVPENDITNLSPEELQALLDYLNMLGAQGINGEGVPDETLINSGDTETEQIDPNETN